MPVKWGTCYMAVPNGRKPCHEDTWRNVGLPGRSLDFNPLEADTLALLEQISNRTVTRDPVGRRNPDMGEARFDARDARFPKSEVLETVENFFARKDIDVYLLMYVGSGKEADGSWTLALGAYVAFDEIIELWEKRKQTLEGHEKLVIVSDTCFSHKLTKRCHDKKYDVIFQGCSSDKSAAMGVFLRNWCQVQQDRLAIDKAHHSLLHFQSGTPTYYIPAGCDPPFFGARRLIMMGDCLNEENETAEMLKDLSAELKAYA